MNLSVKIGRDTLRRFNATTKESRKGKQGYYEDGKLFLRFR
jgi:hypothetical protein